MKFEEVLPALREGKKIRRRSKVVNECYGVQIIANDLRIKYRLNDAPELAPPDYFGLADIILADDWEVVE